MGSRERDNASLNRVIRESLIEQKFEGDEGSNSPPGVFQAERIVMPRPACLFD